jgi:Family of unknown function (DUF6504)
VRTYGEVIDVRTVRPGAGPEGLTSEALGAPAQFLWRGRLYLVRDVLAHWVELGAWWSLPRRAGVPARVAGPRYDDGPGPDAADEPPPRSVAVDVGAVEREVWRVEAAPGRSSSPGVYDLVRDVPARSGAAPGGASRWRLARTLD